MPVLRIILAARLPDRSVSAHDASHHGHSLARASPPVTELYLVNRL
jgi:hypothetical protein